MNVQDSKLIQMQNVLAQNGHSCSKCLFPLNIIYLIPELIFRRRHRNRTPLSNASASSSSAFVRPSVRPTEATKPAQQAEGAEQGAAGGRTTDAGKQPTAIRNIVFHSANSDSREEL